MRKSWDDGVTERMQRLSAMFDSLRAMNLYNSEVALKNHETSEMTNRTLLMHYLVVLRRYIDYLVGKNNYAKDRFQMLWDDSLLRRITPKNMMIIHRYFLDNVPKDIQVVPQLVITSLTHPDLIPVKCRCDYYERFYELVSRQVPMSPDDPRPHYRGFARGNFYDSKKSRQDFPESLIGCIREDSVEATEIMLTLMKKDWSADMFGLALKKKAWKIIRHLAQILTPDDEAFSAYDCIIHILQNIRPYGGHTVVSALKCFEEEQPGILRNYHDDYGNNLLCFVAEKESYGKNLREKIGEIQSHYSEIINYLIGAGCDPNEQNTLFLSFNDFAK